MHCSSCYGMIFLKLRDRAVAVNHCYFQHSLWYRQLMSVPSRGHKRGQNEMPWLLPHPWQASRCLKEGEAPTRLGFASGWEWHMLTRSKRTGRWRAVVQKGMPDKLQDRQEHCIVQTGSPNEDLVLVGAPSNDLMSRRHPIFLSPPAVVWRHKLADNSKLAPCCGVTRNLSPLNEQSTFFKWYPK